MLSEIQIGLAVKSARLASGLSAKQLAEQSGLTPSALSKIEVGKQTLSLAQGANIAKALGVRVDQLIALAEKVESISIETSSLRDQLRNDLRRLHQMTIETAIAVNAAERKDTESA